MASIAEDFWKRRIKDRRGRLWGKQVPKTASTIQEVNRMVRCLLGKRNRTVSPYQQFYRAAPMVPPHEAQGAVANPVR